MTGRADFALELQLEGTEREAMAAEVKDAIMAVLCHMRRGQSRHRRGGQKLIKLLEQARLRASEEAEWYVVRLLQDALDYATGRILKPEFEERYQLFQDGVRSDTNRVFVTASIVLSLHHAASAGRKFLEGNGNATASDLLAHLESLGDDARFLDAPDDRPGRYRIVRGSAERAKWLERVLRSRIDVEDPVKTARRIITSPQALRALADDETGQALLKAMELKQRADGLAELRKITEDRTTTEADLQRALQDQLWIFGGQYVGAAARRRLVPGDEIDIPLIRGDGSLHVIELKRAMGVPIVKRYRDAWVPTAEVHNAIGQAVNYLVGLDENRQDLHVALGIETRRASAIVLIGHPATHSDVPEIEITETLRVFNTHLSRVEVLTYKELLDNAERSLGSFPVC